MSKFNLGKSLLYEYQNNKEFKDTWDISNLKRKAEKERKKFDTQKPFKDYQDQIRSLQNEIKNLESYASGQIKYNNADPLDDDMVEISEKITRYKNQIDAIIEKHIKFLDQFYNGKVSKK